MQDLDAAVLGGFKGSFKLDERQTPVGYYVAYSVPGKFRDKPDTVELLLKPEGIQDRQWEGDRAGAAVFYRSIAGVIPESALSQAPVISSQARCHQEVQASETQCHSLQALKHIPRSCTLPTFLHLTQLFCHPVFPLLPPRLCLWRCNIPTPVHSVERVMQGM